MSAFGTNRPRFNLNLGARISNFFRSNDPLNRLILVNVCVYLGFLLLGIVANLAHFLQAKEGGGFDQWVLDWFGVHSNWWLLITRPWTIVTSIFLHLDFWHIFFNMLMLWVGGKIFHSFFRPKQIYTVYILGGLIGNLFFVLSYNFFPIFADVVSQAVAIGASGGVLAVLIAAAAKAPNYQLRLILIGNVPLKWIAIVMVIIDVISIQSGNSGGHFAHLGGALFGFLYVYIPKWNHNLKSKHNSKPKVKKQTQNGRPKSDEQYNAERADHRKRVDEILDKVAKSGYQNLSAEEKEFLFKTSNKKNW
jgi:membrane associated rhomboid family serine protease